MENDKLMNAIERAAGDLPEGWTIRINVQNGYGGVHLYDPEDDVPEDFEGGGFEGRFDEGVLHALSVAKANVEPSAIDDTVGYGGGIG